MGMEGLQPCQFGGHHIDAPPPCAILHRLAAATQEWLTHGKTHRSAAGTTPGSMALNGPRWARLAFFKMPVDEIQPAPICVRRRSSYLRLCHTQMVKEVLLTADLLRTQATDGTQAACNRLHLDKSMLLADLQRCSTHLQRKKELLVQMPMCIRWPRRWCASSKKSTSSPPHRMQAPPPSLRTMLLELAGLWRARTETDARARLIALQCKDPQAFADHVSALKVSTLLKIMERTDIFMQCIQHKVLAKRAHPEEVPVSASLMEPSIYRLQPHLRNATDYERFHAFVKSAMTPFHIFHAHEIHVEKQPDGMRATLMPHQMDGLRFLLSLHANAINGILADEMGVGKTIQTLAFLLALKQRSMQDGDGLGANPHLILAPLSVIREWVRACELFTPTSLRVAQYRDLEHPASEAANYDLVLLPIHAVRELGSKAARISWNYVVVDEAHRAVSNLTTATAAAILRLRCQRRLVLTGTPLNSDLRELWSLLYYLNEDVFDEQDSFDEVFRRPFQVYNTREMDLTSEEQELLVLRLHQILQPFMLRRTKHDIDKSLRMTIHQVRCPISTIQSRLLNLLRSKGRMPWVFPADDSPSSPPPSSSCDGEGEGAAAAATTSSEEAQDAATPNDSTTWPYLSRCALSNNNVSGLTAQVLCTHAFMHPFCSQVLHHHNLQEHKPSSRGHDDDDGENDDGAADMVLATSCKFLMLHILLSRLFCAQRKVVIFTHWLDCIDLIHDYLRGQGWAPHTEVLTGATDEMNRKASVDRFREDATCLFFIVSMKAGGCGINLQAAHMVILMDRDYTTTNEEQALARVLRIGQRHTVRALYFTTDDPAEARVAEVASEKDKPRAAIIEDGDYHQASLVSSRVSGEISADVHAAHTIDSTIDGCALWGHTRQRVGSTSSCASSCASPHEWLCLEELVRQLDELVLTESDTCGTTTTTTTTTECGEGPVARRLQQSRPSAVHVAGGTEWDFFWRVWSEAVRGPDLLSTALNEAVARGDYAHGKSEARRQLAVESSSRRLRLLTLKVPERFADACSERGIEGDEEIAEEYLRYLERRKGPSKARTRPLTNKPTTSSTSDEVKTMKAGSSRLRKRKRAGSMDATPAAFA